MAAEGNGKWKNGPLSRQYREYVKLAGRNPCGARFTRNACSIDIGTAVVELALDQGILMGGGKETSLCEMEIELKDGSKEAAETFADYVAKKYGLVPEKKSKFRRALDLTKE